MRELGGVPGAELFQKIGPMEIDGTRADTERPSGLLAGAAANDLRQRNTFFGGQALVPGEWLRQDVEGAGPPLTGHEGLLMLQEPFPVVGIAPPQEALPSGWKKSRAMSRTSDR
jgi:hypothetical protein